MDFNYRANMQLEMHKENFIDVKTHFWAVKQ